tara:strand:- start:6454 stop:7191 length:738 start_codon:yes stop_codon:yes gene_type:complete
MSFQLETNSTTAGFQTQGTAPAATDGTMSTEQLDSLVKRDANAQQHITNLETERQEQRDATEALQLQIARLEGTLSATGNVKDMLAGMQTGQPAPAAEPAQATPSVEDLVAQATAKVTADLDAKAQMDLQSSNYNKIAEVLTTTFGDKANDHVTAIATQNSMTFAEAQDMARNNPTLFSNLFIKTAGTPLAATSPSTGFTNTSAAQDTNVMNAESWNQLRRDKRSKFWTDAAMQKQYREWITTQH